MLVFLHRLSCAGLGGAQVFFATVAAQLAFPREVAQLPREAPARQAAADLVGAMLGRLDAATLCLCAVAVGCALAARLLRAAAVLPLIAGLCAAISASVVTPRIHALREAGATATSGFGLLHGVSSGLLLLEIALLCAALWHSRER